MTTTTSTPAPRTARMYATLQGFAAGEHYRDLDARLGLGGNPHAVARNAANTLRRSAMKVRFGVEIEYTGISREAAARAINDAGVAAQVEGYNHQTRSHVKVIGDASVTGSRNNRGGEVVLPPLAGEAGFDTVRKVCDALTDAGARVDRSCGLHVHVDTKGLTAEGIVRYAEALYAAQPMLRSLVSPSRRTGQWSRPTRSGMLHTFRSAVTGAPRPGYGGEGIDRYTAINLTAYGRHGTIECRLHHGTLNGNKIVRWIEMLLAIRATVEAETDAAFIAAIDDAGFGTAPAAENADHLAPVAAPLKALVRFGGLPKPAAEFLAERAESLAGAR